jgi:coenzyme F420-reducing hydrogenase delta subunit
MPGDCHYLEGNANARRRVIYVKGLLTEIGLESDRVWMFNMSSAMADGFVNAAVEMNQRITGLGLNPLKRVRGG